MRRSSMRILVLVLAITFSIVAIMFVPDVRDYFAARSLATPIITMLQQGDIEQAGNALVGGHYVSETNKRFESDAAYKPLSPRAAELVQKEMIRIFPSVKGDAELFCMLRALIAFQEQKTLALQDVGWQVVEEATQRYNKQMQPRTIGFFVSSSQDGNKYVNAGGLDDQRQPLMHGLMRGLGTTGAGTEQVENSHSPGAEEQDQSR